MNCLIVVPARGGSKGIPKKNIKPLMGKPLIHYTIESARSIFPDADICVSTDSAEIKAIVEQTGLSVPFLRPEELATDDAGTHEVLLHAIEYYSQLGRKYDSLVLLQPTSPMRKAKHIQGALEKYSMDIDMVVSVKESRANPYYTLMEENNAGFLEKSKKGDFLQRQSLPKVYEYNGAIYVINIESLKQRRLNQFEKIKKYVMDDLSSIDIDSPLDWNYCEFLFEKGWA